MKLIINNIYLKGFKFLSSEEASTFFNNQEVTRNLLLENTIGDNHYCYVCYHSLTKEKQFVLSFNSDLSEDDLSFLYWGNFFVLDTGKHIFLIDEVLNIKASLEITTPLVGLYVINNENLLVLEEAFMRVINYKGEILKNELFDLIENFSIEGNSLLIQTSEGSKIIELV